MSATIDLTNSGWTWPESAVGDVLLLVNPGGAPAEGELGDVILWTTHAGVARGEVVGWGAMDGPPSIPGTRVKVTSASHLNRS